MGSEAEIGSRYWGLAARSCDTCRSAPAHLYCRADAAYLCGTCDARVHGANTVASRHERVWVCEVCEQAPASVSCKADAAALCATCDADIHSANPLSRRHERQPLLPFLDTPAKPTPLFSDNASWLLPTPNPKSPDLKSSEFYFNDSDSYLDLDFSSSIHMADSLVPAPAPAPIKLSFSAYTDSHSGEAGVVPEAAAEVSGGGGGREMTARMDREARVMRYREKRKSRRFEKTIRYASRKAYAETRPRIKGRFAKRTDVAEPVPDPVYFLETSYGVVPSF